MMSGEISISSTGNIIALLAGNITSIAVSLAITVVGSVLFPERFDFRSLKQKILLVDDRVRSMIKHDTDEELLQKASKFCKRVGFGIALFLVIVWPATFYVTEYVFTAESFTAWVGLALVWAFGAAGVVILLPIIEARNSIREILGKVGMSSSNEDFEQQHGDSETLMRILVPVDGSVKSLKALNNANYLFRGAARVKIYLLHVIEWPDEEENMDEQLSSQMLDEGRMILRSIVVPQQINDYKRIVKLGNPPAKIAETADKLNVDLIAMGQKGLGNSKDDFGHVTRQVLKLTSKPVILL